MTVTQLQARVLERLGELSATPAYFKGFEVLAKLNEAQRFFALLTLCLEKTSSFSLDADTTFVHLLPSITDFLLPLRVRITAGARLRSNRLQDLDALKTSWQKTSGAPERYVLLGLDLFVVTPQPTTSTGLSITHAHAPAVLSNPSQSPEIPTEYHPALIDYAVHALRAKEGGQEFLKTLPLLNRFIEDAEQCAQFIRKRSLAQRYDRLPFELGSFDRSRLIRPAVASIRRRPWLETGSTAQRLSGAT